MKEFSKIITDFITTKKKQRYLADKFEVAVSTIKRWALGVARPHPRIQKLIVMFIEEWKE